MATSAATRLPAVAVLGMGGVGGVLAASLSTAGRCRLSVVARGAGHAWLCDEGLTVQLHEGAMIHCRPDVILDAEQLEPSPQDMVLVCTKSHQVGSAIPALKQLLGPETVVVPCINGMPWWYFHGTGGHHDSLRLRSSDPSGQLWEAVPPQRVLGTVGMVSGDLDRRDGGFTWRSKWPSSRNHITIGDPAAGGGASSRTAAVRDLFCTTTVPVRIEMASDIRSNIFDKLLINASLNTISTLTRTDCGQVVADPQLRSLLRSIIAEVSDVAAALDPPPVLTWNADSIIDMYSGQYGLRTSMLQDLLAHKELERESIVDTLVELGEVTGVQTPLLGAMAGLLTALDATSRGLPFGELH